MEMKDMPENVKYLITKYDLVQLGSEYWGMMIAVFEDNEWVEYFEEIPLNILLEHKDIEGVLMTMQEGLESLKEGIESVEDREGELY